MWRIARICLFLCQSRLYKGPSFLMPVSIRRDGSLLQPLCFFFSSSMIPRRHGTRFSRQPTESAAGKQTVERQQGQRQSDTNRVLLLIASLDCATDGALLEGVDRLENLVEAAGISGHESAASTNLCQALQQGQVGGVDRADDVEPGNRLVLAHNSARLADGDRVHCDTQVARQRRRLFGLERARDRGLVAAVGQQD